MPLNRDQLLAALLTYSVMLQDTFEDAPDANSDDLETVGGAVDDHSDKMSQKWRADNQENDHGPDLGLRDNQEQQGYHHQGGYENNQTQLDDTASIRRGSMASTKASLRSGATDGSEHTATTTTDNGPLSMARMSLDEGQPITDEEGSRVRAHKPRVSTATMSSVSLSA